MRVAIVCMMIFGVVRSASAQQIVVAGRVVDEIEKESIALVKVSTVASPKHSTLTDKEGFFYFNYTFRKDDKLVFQHAGFESKEVLITKKLIKKTVGDTLYLNVALPWRTLSPFGLPADRKPDTLFGSPEISVSDYQFYDNDRLIMLVYEKNLKRGSRIVLVDQEQNILDEELVPERAEKLYRDYLGRVNVICQHYVYRVRVFGKRIDLKQIDPVFFQTHVVPVVDTGNGMVYYSNYNPDFPAFQYYRYDPIDSSHHEIMKVEDKFMMELYCSEYKYVDGAEKVWAMHKESQTGIDKEIWIGLKYFTNSLYYKSLYAPLFVLDEELVVFDHYSDMMHAFDGEGKPIDSTSIYYHKINGKGEWDNQVIHDEITNKLYAVFKNAGYYTLSEIDLNTGSVTAGQRLYYKYAEQIQVRNGRIFYIYRPFESLQKKFLYVERMRPSESTSLRISEQ